MQEWPGSQEAPLDRERHQSRHAAPPGVSRLARLYARLPAVAQTLAVSLEGWRLQRERRSGSFRERLDGYLARRAGSEDEILAVRRERLRAVLRHAAREIPYWRETFRDAGLDPERVDGPDDLRPLPVLTKTEILRLGRALHWEAARKSEIRSVHTSGTTGAGLVFPTTLDAIRDQWAVWWSYRIRHGLALGDWMCTFGGRVVVPGSAGSPPYRRVNYPGRQVLYSQYHLNARTVRWYLDDLRSSGHRWFHGYPSTLSYLANLASEHPRPLWPRPAVVTLGAENLLTAQRRAIRDVFGVSPVQHYGLAEAVANASECPEGRLHVDEDFAAVEFLPAGNGAYRIVGTCFENLAMPFIRYDTGDVARLYEGRCPCGVPGRVIESIDGRQEEMIALSDGTKVGRLDHLFKDLVNICEAQIEQDRPGRCVIRVVPRSTFGPSDVQALLAECREKFGDRLEVRIETVESLPRRPGGKLRLVVGPGSGEDRS